MDVMVTFVNAVDAIAFQTSAVPRWVFVLRANVQVRPAPDTATFWEPEAGPSAATNATRSSPAAAVENAGVATVPRASLNTVVSIAIGGGIAGVVNVPFADEPLFP